jgi:hypothetical protein
VSSLNVGLVWGTAVTTLETRSRTMPASKEPGIGFSMAWRVSLPSKLPRRLSRGLGVAEYALWKSVSESSVVPVSAGVSAGVTGVVVRGRSTAAAAAAASAAAAAAASEAKASSYFEPEVVIGRSGRVGVLASSCLEDRFSPGAVSVESPREIAVLLDVTVSARFRWLL